MKVTINKSNVMYNWTIKMYDGPNAGFDIPEPGCILGRESMVFKSYNSAYYWATDIGLEPVDSQGYPE